MKRRSFLRAVGGAIAAVFVPVVAAEQVKRLIAFPPPRLAMSLQEYNRVRPRFIFEHEPEFWDYHPPETVAELRAAIESGFETVHEFKRAAYEETSPLMSGFGLATKSVERNWGPIYKGFVIAGEGANEKEAVANAFNDITWDIGGKEMIWRVAPRLIWNRNFDSGGSVAEVRARVIVPR